VTARVFYDARVEAPIPAGQPLGAVVVVVPGLARARFELVAGNDVARGGLATRIGAAARLTRDRAVGLLPGRD
jgi:D-alanyl-D-alanine carboxypeptidase (penicillin-binding protein 5/6)